MDPPLTCWLTDVLARGIASGGGGGFWGAREREPPFCELFLSKQRTIGGENDVTIW